MREPTNSERQQAGATDRAGATERPFGRILGHSDLVLWGLSPRERLHRSLIRAGVTVLEEEDGSPPSRGTVVLVLADFVFDPVILDGLIENPGTIVVAEDGQRPVAAHVDAAQALDTAALLESGSVGASPQAVTVVAARALASNYRQALRKREAPYVMLLTRAELSSIEKRMFKSSYKGVTDFVTKWVWPVPAFWVTKLAARLHLRPNALTTASLALVIAAFFLFLGGHYGPGLIAAWLMTFLDTVDGKLARLTLTSSRLGNLFDHGIDLVHPPFWYVAWALGLGSSGRLLDSRNLLTVLVVIVGGYVMGRLVEGAFIWYFKMEIHVWRPVDSLFRQFTARRNPNLVLLSLGTLAGRPDLGLLAVAAWTAVSLAFHIARFLGALHIRHRGDKLESWLAGTVHP